MRVAGTRWASRNAISLFPAAVGPQITGMKECSSAAKAELELVPREMHDGRPAMDVVRGKWRRRERDEQRAHLARRQFTAGVDRGLARHGCRQPLMPGRGGRVAIAGESGDRFAQTALGVEARMRHRHAADDQGVAAEAFDLEAEPLEQLAMRVERIGLRGTQMQREGEEQALRGHLAALQGAHEPLEEYSLMRRMLVDEDNAILPLEHQIRSA